ncbi:flavodoxin domain-containing protein [Gleimia sp. 6138-11-ORH1]|uniref:flavodoxin domain-containing protein n=1 Tax=Gleimia sp. 6138-11-ORH1 TaxID=2973937 RepID=UPI00216895D2|nr:flavodoxin domain-containing protein [Gleimia sp. 6138-11-ORH1]MCS4484956.1 flavodoxin domain-containing protein [Gleimia sp. 6138-11-ORH1]
MKFLVTYATRHGSTAEVAQTIADELTSHGLDVELREVSTVDSIAEYDALIIGSAVYTTQWVGEMRNFIKQFETSLIEKPVWAFSVGLSGVPKSSANDPVRVGPVLLRLKCEDHRTFAGALKPKELSWRERSQARLGGAIEGDFRDWEEIRQWARSIAKEIENS